MLTIEEMGMRRGPWRNPEQYEVAPINQMLAIYECEVPSLDSWFTSDLYFPNNSTYPVYTYSVAPEYGVYVTHYVNTDGLPTITGGGRNAQIIIDNYRNAGGELQGLVFLGYTEIMEEATVNSIRKAFRAAGQGNRFNEGCILRCEHGTAPYSAFARNNTLAQIVTSLIRRFRTLINSDGRIHSYVGLTMPQSDGEGNFYDPIVYMVANIRA